MVVFTNLDTVDARIRRGDGLAAAFMALSFVSTCASGLKAIAAASPCGTVFVGMTETPQGATEAACSAAMMMFELFGKMKT